MDQLAILFVDHLLGLVDDGLALLIDYGLELVVDELAVLLVDDVLGFVDDGLAAGGVHELGGLALVVDCGLVLGDVVLFGGDEGLGLGDAGVAQGVVLWLLLLGLVGLNILIGDDPLPTSILLILVMLIDHLLPLPPMRHLHLMVLRLLRLILFIRPDLHPNNLWLPNHNPSRLLLILYIPGRRLLDILDILRILNLFVAHSILSVLLVFDLFVLFDDLALLVVDCCLLVADDFDVLDGLGGLGLLHLALRLDLDLAAEIWDVAL